MTAATFVLHRHEDKSGVSGTGLVAEGVEFSDGSVALRWHGEYPSTAAWEDIRGVEAIHGHGGLTVVEYAEPDRLLTAYQRVVPWMLSARYADRPVTCAPHPIHPDRLLLAFKDERVWRFWIALLDGSSDAAVHEDTADETEHRWVSADGNLWLVYHTRHTTEHPLETFDREDR